MYGKSICVVVTIAAIIIASFFLGYSRGIKKAKENVNHISDTTYVYRTRYIDSPIEKSSTTIGRIAVPNYKFLAFTDTTETVKYVHDTTIFYLPREQKYYEEADGQARIWVSGYDPRIERFEWDEGTAVVTASPKPKKWNVSVSAGYGVGKEGLTPLLGVTVGRSLISW